MELTNKHRATLDEAERILIGLLVDEEEVLMFSLHGGWEGLSTTYFTPNKVQHGIWPTLSNGRPTLSDKITRALEIRAEEESQADEARAERIERLRDELERLTGESE